MLPETNVKTTGPNCAKLHAYVMEHSKDKLAFPAKVDQYYFKGGCGALMLDIRDGNGSGRGRVEDPRTRPQNPNSKPAPNPKPHSGENLAPTPKPAGARNPPGTPKPASTPPSSTSSAPPRCCHQLLLNELKQRQPDLASELHPAARRSASPTLELLLFDGGTPPVASFGAGAPPRRLLRAAGKLRHRVEPGAARRESRGGRPRRPTSGRLPGRRAAAEGEREEVGGPRAVRPWGGGARGGALCALVAAGREGGVDRIG
jgi:hypothetical protein